MTTANTTAQIATFLNAAPNAIKSVTEMAWVFCVVVRGQRARFVSKKVIKVEVVEMDFVTAFNEKFGTKAQLWQKHGLTRIYLNDRKLPAYIEVKNGVPQTHPAAPSEIKAFIKENSHLEICAVPSATTSKAQSFREQMLATASQPDSIQDSWKAYHGQQNTEKALNAMYGKGGWDRWDREDYEG